MKKLVLVFGLAVLAVPGVARAQAKPEPKVFFTPTIGAVVGAGPGAAASASVSFKVGSKAQILGEFGHMTNVMPDSVEEEVEVAAALAANAKGGKHSASSSADANYGLVKMRYALRDISGAHTFMEIGVGAAHVTSEVSAAIRGSASLQGDISNLVTTPFTSATPVTKPMFSIGGGIILGVTRNTAVEIGARYMQIMTDAPAIKTGNISGAFRVGF